MANMNCDPSIKLSSQRMSRWYVAILVAVATVFATDSTHAASTADARFVQSFLKTHCIRCHNAKKKKGKFNLEDLKVDVGAHRESFAKIFEALSVGDMPPEREKQPSLADLRKVTQWVKAGLGNTATSTAKSVKVPVRPHEGNHLPHSLLFGIKPGPSVPPPARLWRLSPEGYSAGLLRSLQIDARRIPQPFALHADPGIKDYAALYWIDEGSTDVLIRNAGKIIDILTDHGFRKPKNGGPARVSLKPRAYKGQRIRPPKVFETLLDPKKTPTRQQLEAAIDLVYRLALVRKPTAKEVESLLALYKKSAVPPGDSPSAVRTMMMAPLLSPEVLHRFEVGRGARIRPGVRMLSPKEVAYAVSLAFSGRREPGLFKAALDGGLKTRDDVKSHVERILNDPQIYKPRLLGFFQEYFGYATAADVCKDEQPDYVHRPEEMVLDTDRLVLDILEKDKDVLKELLTTRKSYVNGVWLKMGGKPAGWNRNDITIKKFMATNMDAVWDRYVKGTQVTKLRPKDKKKANTHAAYGLKQWPAKQPVDLPGDRIGILMQPSWLVAWSSNFFNDPVRRGLWIRERLLGHAVPPVPVGVVIVLPDDPKRTLRDRMQITKEAACWKCHQKIDDLGFPFEAFDHFGRPRTQEISFDWDAALENKAARSKKYAKGQKRPEKKQERYTLPLSTKGIIRGSGDPKLDGPVRNAAEMIRKLAESDRVRQVFVRHVFRYYLGRNETPDDAATLQEADRVYVKSGGSFKALVLSLLSSESFLYRSVSTQGISK